MRGFFVPRGASHGGFMGRMLGRGSTTCLGHGAYAWSEALRGGRLRFFGRQRACCTLWGRALGHCRLALYAHGTGLRATTALRQRSAGLPGLARGSRFCMHRAAWHLGSSRHPGALLRCLLGLGAVHGGLVRDVVSWRAGRGGQRGRQTQGPHQCADDCAESIAPNLHGESSQVYTIQSMACM